MWRRKKKLSPLRLYFVLRFCFVFEQSATTVFFFVILLSFVSFQYGDTLASQSLSGDLWFTHKAHFSIQNEKLQRASVQHECNIIHFAVLTNRKADYWRAGEKKEKSVRVCAFVCQGGLGGMKNRREINIVALCSANVNNAKGRT